MRKVTIVIDDPNEKLVSEAIINAAIQLKESTGIRYMETSYRDVPGYEHHEMLQVPPFMNDFKRKML